MKKVLLALALVVAVWWIFFRDAPAPEPGVRINLVPEQTAVNLPPWTVKDYEILPLARYKISGRVLARKRYFFDDPADIAPFDLALGWQGMSDSGVLGHFYITQNSRWYEYLYDAQCPLPPNEIAVQSANVHCLPANDEVFSELKSLRRNAFVELEGYLVEVRKAGHPPWRSSLVRDDAGNGSCEILWVEGVQRFSP